MLQITEQISEGLSRTWTIAEIFCMKRTEYQEVCIGKTAQGITLFCDNDRQSSELSQRIYHEGQIVPALLLADKLDKVVILGSSEGVVTHICQNAGVKNIFHVDIDRECVELCAKYLPYGYSAQEIRKYVSLNSNIQQQETQLIFGDGLAFLNKANACALQYDIIAMDLPDESTVPGHATSQDLLYNLSTLAKVKEALSSGGVFITQAGNSSVWRNKNLMHMYSKMQQIFPTVVYFELEEQDWVWLLGYNNKAVINPLAIMQDRLPKLAYKARHIDVTVLEKATIPPLTLRTLRK